jgi:hypothetical protein
VTPCARGSRSRERRPGITRGMPELGQAQTTPITCHFCAMQRDLMCVATYVTLGHTRFCPQCGVLRGAVMGKKRRFPVKSACSGRFWGRFRAISAPACQHPGTSVIWRHPHGQRAHFREYTASVQIRSRAPGRNVAPRRFDRAGARPGLLPFGARNREQIDAVSGCRSQAAQHQASRKVKVSAA